MALAGGVLVATGCTEDHGTAPEWEDSATLNVTGQCVAPPSAMTGWWPGDGNTDDVVGNRDAFLRDEATTGAGLVSDAFVLDGDGDFVEVPHDAALNVGTGDFTVDFWVYFNTTAGEQVLVEKYIEDFTLTPPGWTLTKLDDNSLFFGTGPGGGGVASPPLSLPENTWIHVAARRSGGLADILVNGQEVASGGSFTGTASSTSSVKFGHRGSPADTPGSLDDSGFFLNGRIDEVELFVGRALSGAEIAAIHAAGSAGKCKVSYSFTGFFQPVDNPGSNNDVVNRANAGRSIPVKFGLGGNQGLAIFSAGYPRFVSTPCDPSDTQDPIEATTTSPPGLSYDPATEQYTYVWKTEKAWSGRCGTFQLGLKDGSDRHALFKFTK